MKNTENPIVKLFSNLSDEDVMQALNEYIEAESTGIFSDDSMVRKLARQCSEITLMDTSSNLLMVQMNVLIEGSLRWMSIREKNAFISI